MPLFVVDHSKQAFRGHALNRLGGSTVSEENKSMCFVNYRSIGSGYIEFAGAVSISFAGTEFPTLDSGSNTPGKTQRLPLLDRRGGCGEAADTGWLFKFLRKIQSFDS